MEKETEDGGRHPPPRQVDTGAFLGWVRRAQFRVASSGQPQNPGQQDLGGDWTQGQVGQESRRKQPFNIKEARSEANEQQEERYRQKKEKLQPRLSTALYLTELPKEMLAVRERLNQLLIELRLAENEGKFRLADQLLEKTQPVVNHLLAYKEKAQAQQQRHDELNGIFADVRRTYFKPGRATLNQEALLKGGSQNEAELKRQLLAPKTEADVTNQTELKRKLLYLAFLKALEAVESDRSEGNLDAVEKQANVYLRFCRENPGLKAREDNCRAVLKQVLHWRMAEEYAAVPAPPWDELTEAKVGEMRARVILEEGYLDGKIETKGANRGSWWLQDVEWGDTPAENRERKQLLFKAAQLEINIPGFPKGGAAPREALGKTVSDTLMSMTGLDFGVPETQMVVIDTRRLPPSWGGWPDDVEVGDQLIGSAQQFAPSQGELKDVASQDPAIFGRIPPTVTQRSAVLDIVALNTDRHVGNFLVGPSNPVDNSVDLVPIDQGLILPTREGLLARACKFGPHHNAVGQMPGADEPFDDEMKAHLRMIDPEEIEQALRRKFQALRLQHPGAGIDKAVTEDSFRMARRAAEFLKYAAEQNLTVNEIYNALAVENVNLLLCDDKERDERFQVAVSGARQRGPAFRRYAAMNDGEKNKLHHDLKGLGWALGLLDRSHNPIEFDIWMLANAPDAFRLTEGNLENPAARAEIEETLEELNYPPDLLTNMATLNAGEQLMLIREACAKAAKSNAGATQTKATDELNVFFGLDQENEENIALMHELEACFPDKKPKIAISKKASEEERRAELYRVVAGHYGEPDATELLKELENQFPKLKTETFKDAAAAMKHATTMLTLLKQTNRSMDQIEKLFYRADHTLPESILATLRGCLEYDQLGGDEMYARMGGEGEITDHEFRLLFLRCRVQEERAKHQDLRASAPTATIRSHLEKKLAQYWEKVNGLELNKRPSLLLRLQTAKENLEAGDLVGAGEALTDVARALKGMK